MLEFTFSWFTLIVGILCFAAGFALAIIIAGSGRGSRMEEKIVGYKSPPKNSRRPKKPTPAPPKIEDSIKFEIAIKGKPEDA